jgi:PhnB protein
MGERVAEGRVRGAEHQEDAGTSSYTVTIVCRDYLKVLQRQLEGVFRPEDAELPKEEIMIGTVKPIPDGYHTATPYLIFNDAAGAIDFYKRAFGAQELMRFDSGGKIGHAEIKIGNSPIMLADEHPEVGARSARSLGGSPVSILLYVENVDGFVAQAIAAGAKVQRPVEDKFYGDRSGTLEDPFGYVWHIATHKEDMTVEEMQKRAASTA